MKIGIAGFRFNHYSTVRSIRGVVPEAEYVPVSDLVAILNRFANRMNRLVGRGLISTFDWNNQFNDFGLNHVDVVHLFNSISYANIPWVTSFETLVPRFRQALHPQKEKGWSEKKVQRGLKVLAGKNCKKVIALSACSAGFERDLLSRYPEYQEIIERKLMILHPGQPLIVEKYDQKLINQTGKVRFIFVGSAFFRKGGREIVEVLKSLRTEHGYDLELILITSFKIENYATFETNEDVRYYQKLVSENADWIVHYPALPNQEVLELMKTSHVGLLPSHADTYGYSVLEFQSAGCPVISTDVRALAEINNEKVGWIIHVPKNRLGEAKYATLEERQILSTSIRKGLEIAIHEIFADRTTISTKGIKALERIRAEHSPADRAVQLKNIYLDIIENR